MEFAFIKERISKSVHSLSSVLAVSGIPSLFFSPSSWFFITSFQLPFACKNQQNLPKFFNFLLCQGNGNLILCFSNHATGPLNLMFLSLIKGSTFHFRWNPYWIQIAPTYHLGKIFWHSNSFSYFLHLTLAFFKVLVHCICYALAKYTCIFYENGNIL